MACGFKASAGGPAGAQLGVFAANGSVHLDIHKRERQRPRGPGLPAGAAAPARVVSLSANSVALASSSALEDGGHFEALASRHGVPRERLFVFSGAEQMLAFIGLCAEVYTDRYHPGVAAHSLGVLVRLLRFPRGANKMEGLREMLAYSPGHVSALNEAAFGALHGFLKELGGGAPHARGGDGSGGGACRRTGRWHCAARCGLASNHEAFA